jgi:hypothetical protein
MTKNDLNLIASFIDNKNTKKELEFASIADDGIYATDTKKAIHFNAPMLGLDLYLHKKLLKGFISYMEKDDEASIDGNGFLRCGNTKMHCDTADYSDFKYPNLKNILNEKFEYKMNLEDIDDIHFELSQRDCFVDDIHLNPIISYSDCKRYIIFFNKQKIDTNTTHTGMAKIVGLYDTEDEVDLVKFTAVVIGREFKTKTQEQLLLNI